MSEQHTITPLPFPEAIDISSAILVKSKFVCQARFASMAYSF